MKAQQILVTPQDIAKLTPGQRQQARMMAEYSKKVAQRYIAIVTNPDRTPEGPTERNRVWYQAALRPFERGKGLTVQDYAEAAELHPSRAGAQLFELLKEDLIEMEGQRGDPLRLYKISSSGKALLSIGTSRIRWAKEGYKSALLTRSFERRQEVLACVSDPLKLLNLIKSPLTPYAWEGGDFLTTKQVADYYAISEKHAQNLLTPVRHELEADGLRVLRGRAATAAKELAQVGVAGGRYMIWTPRAVVRFGLIVRESAVAIWLRQTLSAGCGV